MAQGFTQCCSGPSRGLPAAPVMVAQQESSSAPQNYQEPWLALAGVKPTAQVKACIVDFLLGLDDGNLTEVLQGLLARFPQLSGLLLKQGLPVIPDRAQIEVAEKVTQFPDQNEPGFVPLATSDPRLARLSVAGDPIHHEDFEHLDPPCIETLKGPTMPTVQFAAPVFFAEEGAGFIDVAVMRVGAPSLINGTTQASIVQWETGDGSAKAGKKYVKSSGSVTFAPTETMQTIRVKLIDDQGWDPTLDFLIILKLDGIQNAEVHRYHTRCRVKIIDDDAFPGQRYREKLLNDQVEQVPGPYLIFEYLRMNFQNPNIRRGTKKGLLLDFVKNLHVVLVIGLKVFLMNELLVPGLEGANSEDPEAGKSEISPANRQVFLIIIALFFSVPLFAVHYGRYRKNFWKIGGTSRKLLQASLMRKYMTYTGAVRKKVDNGEVVLALFKEIPAVVDEIYCVVFPLCSDMTMLVLLFLYQTVGTKLLGLKTSEPAWIALNTGILVFFPVVLSIALKMRFALVNRSMLACKGAERAAVEYTLDMLDNYNLLADYLNRGKAVGKFEGKIDAFNGAYTKHSALDTNNSFIPRSVSVSLCAIWVIGGGLLVCNGEISLGTFLAQWEVIDQIGSAWTDIYEHMSKMQNCETEFKTIVRLMNYPVENREEKQFMDMCAEKVTEISAALHRTSIAVSKSETSVCDGPLVDQLPIRLGELCHRFDDNLVFSQVTRDFRQGLLHLIAGRRGSGKTTLLKILAGRTLMQNFEGQGYLYIPQHLRVLHVSKDPVFFLGTLADNLTYGVPDGDKDGRVERVMNICKAMNIGETTLELIAAGPKCREAHWNEELSKSDRQLLNIIRGLLANPEVLCIHKPTMGLGPNTIPIVLGALKAYVVHRGIDQDPDRFLFRRPRTCVFSSSVDADYEYADEVHHPFEHTPLEV